MTNHPRLFTNFASFWNPTPDLYFRAHVQSGTSYTALASDLGSTAILTNAGAVAVTLGAPSNTEPMSSYGTGSGANVPQVFCKGWHGEYLRLAAANARLTPAAGTINGAAYLDLSDGEGARVITDGVNYYAQIFRAGGSSANAWSDWTPTITAEAGSFSSVTTNVARYQTIGNTVFFHLKFTINTVGSASGAVMVTLPVNPASADIGTFAYGRENANFGTMLQGRVLSTTDPLRILTDSNGSIIGAGNVIHMRGFYEV